MKIVILCSLDAFANAVKPRKILEHLSSNDTKVELFSTLRLSRMSDSGPVKYLPALNYAKLKLFMLEIINLLARISGNSQISKLIYSNFLVYTIKQRGKVIHSELKNKNIDAVICENSSDIGFLQEERIAKVQLLDLPSPSAEELYFGDNLTTKAYEKLKNFEIDMYSRADYLSFHWHTYTDYVQKNKYHGNNIIDMSYGVDSKHKHTIYSERPRIIFMGLLNGYWVNLHLLSELCKRYPNIDVYGGPEPPKHFGINYKGYAPSKDIIAEYQFGLITISDDPLRRSSFSSKQLEYMSYGLPVLTPSWRKDDLLAGGSIYYDDADQFGEIVANYMKKEAWLKKSEASLAIANDMSWTKVFTSLDNLLLKDIL